MNRYQELTDRKTKLAVLGVNATSLELALDLGSQYNVLIGDADQKDQMDLERFLSRKGFQNVGLNGKSLELMLSYDDLRFAGVYYLNGISSSIMDWGSIKDTAALIGKTLSPGDWVVFGPHIDPDMAEVVLLDIIKTKSGLDLCGGFEVSFCPAHFSTSNFDNMSNEMKLSHNLIVSQVEKIFNTPTGGEFGSNQITYRDPKHELNEIKAKIAELWVPTLNEMTPDTFREFVTLAANNSFLDAYSHLKMSNELRVDWKRFFQLAIKAGLNQNTNTISDLTEVRMVG